MLRKGRFSLSASGSIIFRLCFRRSQTKMMSDQESIYHLRSNTGMLPLFPCFSVFLPDYFCGEDSICLDSVTNQPYKSKNKYLTNYEYLTNSCLLTSRWQEKTKQDVRFEMKRYFEISMSSWSGKFSCPRLGKKSSRSRQRDFSLGGRVGWRTFTVRCSSVGHSLSKNFLIKQIIPTLRPSSDQRFDVLVW